MNKSVIIAVTVAAAVILIGWLITFPLLINKDSIKAELVSSIDAATGMKLEIQGDVALKVFPLPHMSIDSMYVLNPAGTKSPFLITIKDVEIWPQFTSLFSKVIIKKMLVKGVEVMVEEMPSGRPSWQEVSRYWSNGVFQPGAIGAQQKNSFNSIYFNVSGMHVSYTSKSGAVTEISDMSVSWTADASAQKNKFNATLNFQNRPVNVAVEMGGSIAQMLSSDTSSLDVSATGGNDTLKYSGRGGYRDGRLLLNGNLDVASEDIAYWIRLYRGQNMEMDASYKKLPLTLKAKISTPDSSRMSISDIRLDGQVIRGGAQIDVNFPSQVSVKAVIKKLNLQDIVDNGILGIHKDVQDQNVLTVPKNRENNPLDVSTDVKIDEADYNGKQITNTTFSAEMNGDEVTIPQLVADLPGESRLVFSGIGKAGQLGLTIEGQVDVQGNSFIDAMGILLSSGFTLPPQDFKRYHMRANAAISPEEIRFSELVGRIEDISIAGGLITKLDTRTTVRAALGITGMNLDHIITLWGIDNWQKALLSNNMNDKNNSVVLVWLKHLGYDVYISSSLENYLLGGKMYEKANVNLAATAAKMEIETKDVLYNGSHITGKARLDVAKDMPRVDVNAVLDEFNPHVFFPQTASASHEAATANPASRWDTEVFDLKWLGLVGSNFDLKIGHFVYGNFDAQDVSLLGNIADRHLTVESFKAKTLGADVGGKLIIDASSIPAVSLTSTVNSLRLERLAALLPLLHGTSGIFNANIIVASNGINMQSWVQNLEGSLGIGGRDIEVHGFNMPGIVHAVSYVRTVADILDVVKRAFPNGNTVFSTFEGAWTISKGVVQTARTRVVNDQSDGTIVGKMDLANWTINTSIGFALKTLDPINVPSITIMLTGDLDKPSIDFDTRALEQYVNNKTSEKMLEKYGAH